MIIGLFFIIVGILWVLSNTGVITASISDFLWPAILVAIGGQILWDGYKKGNKCCEPKNNDK